MLHGIKISLEIELHSTRSIYMVSAVAVTDCNSAADPCRDGCGAGDPFIGSSDFQYGAETEVFHSSSRLMSVAPVE